MGRILFFALLFNVSNAFSQCVNLYINEYVDGDPICKFYKGDVLSICDNEISGCPQTFYVGKVYNKAGGIIVYEIKLDNVYYAQKYGEIQINPKTQLIGFLIGNSYGVYSYINEVQMSNHQAKQSAAEKIETEKKIALQQSEDNIIKDKIRIALSSNEYFKAIQLYEVLHKDDSKLLTEINNFWLPLKAEYSQVYSNYQNEFKRKKNEYFSNPNAFEERYKVDIKENKITINGQSAYSDRIKNTKDLVVRKYREEILSQNPFLYSNLNGKHLIVPYGVTNNYFPHSYMNSDEIQIKVLFDTLSKSYYSKIDFLKDNNVLNVGIIINENTFTVRQFNLPYSDELKKLKDQVINEMGENILNQFFPILSIDLDFVQSIPVQNIKSISQPGEGKKNDQFELIQKEFSVFESFLNQKSPRKIDLHIKNLYNPFIFHLVKRIFPNADSLILIKGDFGDALGKEALHLEYSQGRDNNIKSFGYIVPLQKGKLELKNKMLFLYDGKGNYSEFNADGLIENSAISLTDKSIESLQLDSSFRQTLYINDSKQVTSYPYPILYNQIQIGFEKGKYSYAYDFGFWNYEDCNYLISNDLAIKMLPAYFTSKLYFERDGYHGVSPEKTDMILPPSSWLYLDNESELMPYITAITSYFIFKSKGEIKKASKALQKADKLLFEIYGR